MAHSADQHALTLVLDPEDDLDDLRAVRQLHARPLGQIVCEPDPTCDHHDLAHHLLEALGKTPGERAHAWSRAQLLLEADQIQDLVLLRAHLLSYPALRQLADTTGQTGTRLWILCPRERPTGPIAQLLERRPHMTSTLPELLEQLSITARLHTADDDLPAAGNIDFPELHRRDRPRRSSNDLAHRLRGHDRCTVLSSYSDAHDWTTAWLEAHPDATQQQAADALWHLVAQPVTASESLVRAHAGLDALAAADCPVRNDAFDHLLLDEWGERRPSIYREEIDRAIELADRCPDLAEAGLIALSLITGCRHRIVRILAADLPHDAAGIQLTAHEPWAVPPALRRLLMPLRALAERSGPLTPLLSSLASGAHPNARTLRRVYDQNHVPDSLRVNGTRTGDDNDLTEWLARNSRDVLDRLHPARLFQH